jgi:SAM-dependent methyltransferase
LGDASRKRRAGILLFAARAAAAEFRLDPIFDTQLLIARKRRALAQPQPGASFLIERVAEDLRDRLSFVERNFDAAAVLFPGTYHAVEAVAASGKAGEVIRIETHDELLADRPGLVAEPETVPLSAGSIDLAVSLLSLQEMNDIPGFLVQVRRALRPDGLFLAAMTGAGTLGELRESLLQAETEMLGGASPRVSPFADVRDAGALLQRAGFALPVADIETLTVRYDSMFALMRDLRGMGATNALAARSRRPVSRRLLLRAGDIYAERFSDPDGRIRSTFSVIWLSGWAPHESQQKPLRPGSARMPLRDALDGKT